MLSSGTRKIKRIEIAKGQARAVQLVGWTICDTGIDNCDEIYRIWWKQRNERFSLGKIERERNTYAHLYILLYHSVRLTVKTSNKVVDERLATYGQRCHQCVRSSTLRRKSTVTWHASDHETPCREVCFSLLGGIAAHHLIHRVSFYLFYDLQVLLRLAPGTLYICIIPK